MDMLPSEQIAEANLADWRKLAQGLHARFVIEDFAQGVRFLGAVEEAGSRCHHHPRVSMGPGYVDLKLITDDAIYRDDDGTEYVVAWPTHVDVELAREISQIATSLGLRADPTAVSVIELGLDVVSSSTVAPVWAALLTGDPSSQGLGTPSDEIRDAHGRVPNLWFGKAPEDGAAQRFHVEVYVAADVAQERIAAVVAAGGRVVDDSGAPGLVVVADPEGNRGVLCVA